MVDGPSIRNVDLRWGFGMGILIMFYVKFFFRGFKLISLQVLNEFWRKIISKKDAYMQYFYGPIVAYFFHI